jgi:hypothetical protein
MGVGKFSAALAMMLVLASATLGFEASSEPLYVRTIARDLATRTYTFECTVPQDAEHSHHWAVRTTSSNPVYEATTQSNRLTYTLDRDALYHISCGAQRGSQYLLYDFHIDLRTSPEANKPQVTVQSTDATTFTASCTKSDAPNAITYWYLDRTDGTIQLTEHKGKMTITASVPFPGLWHISCGMWDPDRSQWTQHGLTLEFFSHGPAYVPNRDGCLPWEQCGTAPPPPAPRCGDGVVNQQSEQCDGAAPAGFSCSTQCMLVPNSAQTCYARVADMPATCAGGAITQDASSGSCRTIVCGGLKVLACEKPDWSRQFFEMYKQSDASGVSVCLGGTCISSNGFAKSPNFPICSGGQPAPRCGDGVVNQATEECDGVAPQGSTCNSDCMIETPPQQGASVDLEIAPWFPQGRNYVFVCAASGFAPTSYSWSFGDGQAQPNGGNDDVWHTFANAGTYTVACTASDGTTTSSDTLSVTVA